MLCGEEMGSLRLECVPKVLRMRLLKTVQSKHGLEDGHEWDRQEREAAQLDMEERACMVPSPGILSGSNLQPPQPIRRIL